MKTNIKPLLTIAIASGLCASSHAQSLLSTMGSAHNNFWNVGAGYSTLAQQFTTGSTDENIGSVSFYTGNIYGSGDPLTVSFYTDASGQPDTLVGSLTGPGSLTADALTTFSAQNLALTGNTTYWLVFDNSGTDAQIAIRQGGSVVTTSSAGWTLGNFGYKNEGSTGAYGFGYNGIANPLFSIDIQPVPEPSSVMVGGLGVGLLFLFRKR